MIINQFRLFNLEAKKVNLVFLENLNKLIIKTKIRRINLINKNKNLIFNLKSKFKINKINKIIN